MEKIKIFKKRHVEILLCRIVLGLDNIYRCLGFCRHSLIAAIIATTIESMLGMTLLSSGVCVCNSFAWVSEEEGSESAEEECEDGWAGGWAGPGGGSWRPGGRGQEK